MIHNPYRGINAHLNSLLQTPGTPEQPALWHSFHNQHITNIVEALNEQLPDGYVALGEHSLQTRSFDVGGAITLSRPEPDVSVFQQREGRTPTSTYSAIAPTWEAPMIEVIEPLRKAMAVVIRETGNQAALGRIVARLELLSPSNKPGGSDAPTYLQKRVEAIQTGVPLIEIDYLHESASSIRDLPPYSYYVAVHDPRPTWQEGTVQVYGFDLDQPVIKFPLPLAQGEYLIFDLNPVYQHTFRHGRWHTLLDYTQVPARWHTYSEKDQHTIRQVMASLGDA